MRMVDKAVRVCAAALLSAALLVPAPAAQAAEAKEASNMQTYVEAMHPGWNLGNALDAMGSETSWGNPPATEQLIRKVADQGFNSIRIPVTWNHRLSAGHEVDPAFMDRVAEVVDWSLDAGLHVMINLHHDSHWILPMAGDQEGVLAKYSAIWTQVAERFKDYPPELSFESINEPRFSEDWNEDRPEFFDMLEQLNLAFHRIVRNSGGGNAERPLVLSGLTASHSQARLDKLAETIGKLDDPNLIATIHYYGLYPFSVNMGGSTSFDPQAEQDVREAFDRAYNTFVARGVPVIIGEYGLLGFDKHTGTIQQGEKLKYFQFVGEYARDRKMTTMLWDNGQHLDRRTLQWTDDELYEAMKSSWYGKTSNAERDFVYIKKGAGAADAAFKLNLKGNELLSVKAGGGQLERDADYRLDGDSLILTADWLNTQLGEGTGEQAKVTLHFSQGADWPIRIMQYERPVLESANGMVGSFAIPARLGGDSLAAMEAVYADGGGNAGPQSWTPYQEYGVAFEPDYAAGVIQLPTEFLQGLKDGVIGLRFHFWSGEQVDYTIRKDGLNVTGLSSEPPSEVGGTSGGTEEPEDGAAASGQAGEADGRVQDGAEAADAQDAQSEADAETSSNNLSLWTGAAAGAAALAAVALSAAAIARRRRSSGK